jgi:hypothetical protein
LVFLNWYLGINLIPPEERIGKPGSSGAGFYLGGIAFVSTPQVIEDIAERKRNRVPAILNHVHELMKNELQSAAPDRFDGPAILDDVDSVP